MHRPRPCAGARAFPREKKSPDNVIVSSNCGTGAAGRLSIAFARGGVRWGAAGGPSGSGARLVLLRPLLNTPSGTDFRQNFVQVLGDAQLEDGAPARLERGEGAGHGRQLGSPRSSSRRGRAAPARRTPPRVPWPQKFRALARSYLTRRDCRTVTRTAYGDETVRAAREREPDGERPLHQRGAPDRPDDPAEGAQSRGLT